MAIPRTKSAPAHDGTWRLSPSKPSIADRIRLLFPDEAPRAATQTFPGPRKLSISESAQESRPRTFTEGILETKVEDGKVSYVEPKKDRFDTFLERIEKGEATVGDAVGYRIIASTEKTLSAVLEKIEDDKSPYWRFTLEWLNAHANASSYPQHEAKFNKLYQKLVEDRKLQSASHLHLLMLIAKRRSMRSQSDPTNTSLFGSDLSCVRNTPSKKQKESAILFANSISYWFDQSRRKLSAEQFMKGHEASDKKELAVKFNKLADFLAGEMLKSTRSKELLRMTRFLVKLQVIFLERGDVEAAFAIHSALSKKAVSRILDKIEVPKKAKKQIIASKELFSLSSGMSAMRTYLEKNLSNIEPLTRVLGDLEPLKDPEAYGRRLNEFFRRLQQHKVSHAKSIDPLLISSISESLHGQPSKKDPEMSQLDELSYELMPFGKKEILWPEPSSPRMKAVKSIKHPLPANVSVAVRTTNTSVA